MFALRRSSFVAALCAAALSAGLCHAEGLAAIPVGGVAGFDPNPFMLGWEFSVSSTLTVTGLAWLDPTGMGLVDSHMVGLFDSFSGRLLVSAAVPSGPAPKYVNGFRVVPVNYLLTPGTYVIVGLRPTNADGALVRASGITTIPAVTYLQERELRTSLFTFTSNTLDLNEMGAFGPSFTVGETSVTSQITGVTNSASFQPSFSPGNYVSIFGTGLASTSRTWTLADFAGGVNLPTTLDGVSATIDGKPAYVEYVSPGQLNVVIPDDATTGPGVPLVVTGPGNTHATTWIDLEPPVPAFFTWLTTTADSGKYLVAQHADYSNVGKAGLYPAQPANFTTPAHAGEIIVLYGTGLGVTNPQISTAVMADKPYPLKTTPTATVGGMAATVVYGGLVTGLSDVYQINLKIPASLPNGDWPLIVNTQGAASFPVLITVGN